MSAAAQLASRAQTLHGSGRIDEAADAFAELASLLGDDARAWYNAAAVAFQAGRAATAQIWLDRSLRVEPSAAAFNLTGHLAALRGDMPAAAAAFDHGAALAPADLDARWGLYEVLQVLGRTAEAVAHQRAALAISPLRTTLARRQPARRTLLVLAIAGPFQANVPLEFVLDVERTTVHKLYVGEHAPPALPPYDVVFNAIADAPKAGPALAAARTLIARQDKPVLNVPAAVALTSRHAIAERFATSRSVRVARTLQASRTTAAATAVQLGLPVIIRPLDSHAGNDLAKIETPAELNAYFAATMHADDFYVSEFIDYRRTDGYFRKYRIVFVDGEPYPVHLAISPRWMIHYYNAPMDEHAWMREEEHAFLRDLASVFDGRRADALREIARALPLDYFGIDCSIAPDGRVLLFEASTAMIVHLRDSIETYPYKHQYVPRIFAALEALVDRRLGRGSGV